MTLLGATVRFDNGDYYPIAVQTLSGTTVTSFQLGPSPTMSTYYLGETNNAAFAKFYNQPNGDPPSVYAGLPPATPTATFGILMDLNEILPPGVQVLNMVIGVGTNDASNLVGGTYSLSTFVSNPANYNLASLSGSMADVNNFVMAATPTITSAFVI